LAGAGCVRPPAVAFGGTVAGKVLSSAGSESRAVGTSGMEHAVRACCPAILVLGPISGPAPDVAEAAHNGE